MSPEEQDRLPPRMRARLLVALPVVAVFAVIMLINAGVQVHTYFEARDSLVHWQERLAEEESGEETERSWNYESPSRRIEGAENDMQRSTETFLLSLGMTAFFGGLLYLGGRKLRQSRG